MRVRVRGAKGWRFLAAVAVASSPILGCAWASCQTCGCTLPSWGAAACATSLSCGCVLERESCAERESVERERETRERERESRRAWGSTSPTGTARAAHLLDVRHLP